MFSIRKDTGIFMILYSVNDAEFEDYGTVLTGYDYSELFENLRKIKLPESGITYVASDKTLETCSEARKMEIRGFGGYPVQLGYVIGSNSIMNCLEFHKSSEYNIAADDIILVLGRKTEIVQGHFDSSMCKAFIVPAGVGVELYSTTLHYAPFNISPDGYRMICVLPKGTNSAKIDFVPIDFEDRMCFGVNKWLIAHPDAPEVKQNAYVGIIGKNITLNMIGVEK